MTYAAADTFFSGGQAPDYLTPPGATGPAQVQSGKPMRSYLYDRQVDSMRAENAFLVRRLIAWAVRPIETTLGITGLRVLSDRQFKDRIAKRLEAGKPVPLLLIKTDLAQALTKNHQVLAIGYRRCKKTAGMKAHWGIDIYDPNHPDEVHTLHYSSEGRAQTRRIDRSGAEVIDPDDPRKNKVGSFRGFFVTPYDVKLPFWVEPRVDRLTRLSRVDALVINERPEEGFDEPGARDGRDGRDGRDANRAGAAGKSGRKAGSGLDGLPVPDVKASEGDTATAVRGKPGHGSGYRQVAGPASYRRLGRVVVTFPAAAPATQSKIEVLDPTSGEVLDTRYGSGAIDLLPGSYSIKITGRLVESVVVEARKDAVLLCGSLKVAAGGQQKVEVLDADQKTVLHTGYGKFEIGLPAGSYFVRVQQRDQQVQIDDGKLTEF
jgi:hypothetical protein